MYKIQPDKEIQEDDNKEAINNMYNNSKHNNKCKMNRIQVFL